MKSKPKREPPIDCDCKPDKKGRMPIDPNGYCYKCGGYTPRHPNHISHCIDKPQPMPSECTCKPSPFGDSMQKKEDGFYCPQCGLKRIYKPKTSEHGVDCPCNECHDKWLKNEKPSECPTYPYYKDDDGNIVVSQQSECQHTSDGKDFCSKCGMPCKRTYEQPSECPDCQQNPCNCQANRDRLHPQPSEVTLEDFLWKNAMCNSDQMQAIKEFIAGRINKVNGYGTAKGFMVSVDDVRRALGIGGTE